MNADDIHAILSQAVGYLRPDVVWVAVRAEPRLLLWPALFALGAWLLVSELQGARARPSLVDQFARQDVDQRLRETLESELAQALGGTPEPGRVYTVRDRNLFPPVLKRMVR